MANVYLGGNTVTATQDDNGDYRLHISFQSGLTISNHKISIEGIPITLYDHVDGGFVLGCSLISAASVEEEDRKTVFQGFRYDILSRATAQGHVPYIVLSSDSSKSSTTNIWGMPLCLGSDRSLMAVNITGTPDKVTYAYLGGVPLVCVLFGDRWYLGICDGSTTAGTTVLTDSIPELGHLG